MLAIARADDHGQDCHGRFHTVRIMSPLALHLLEFSIYALAVLLAAAITPGMYVRSFGGAFVFAILFAILDKVLWWVIAFLALPLVVLTFGIFLFFIHAIIFWMASHFVKSIEIRGAGAAILGSLFTALFNSLLVHLLLPHLLRIAR